MFSKRVNEPHLYRKLFWLCFRISACTFGGGIVVMSVLQKTFVEELKWIEADEMMDLIAIAQSSPGVMSVNSAIIIGYRVGGAWGAAVTMLGTIMPPMIILSVISVFYKQFRENRVIALLLRGMQAGVAAVLINVAYTMSRQVLKDKSLRSLLMLLGATVAVVGFGADIILVILICAVIGCALTLMDAKKGGEQA